MTRLSFANHLLLELAPAPPTENWQVHINRLCLQGLAPWLADEFAVSARQLETVARSHTAIWDLVSGSAVQIGEATRLVLVPSAAIDLSELRVPQEWVDIPSWVGDYYVGVRVNPNSGQLCVWGYTTHVRLKQQGRYDAADRSYCLDGEVVTDLAVLPVVRALGVTEPTRSNVAALPELPVAQVESLVQRLTRPDCLMPRLAVPFSLWGALLADATVRSRLSGHPATNLSQWLSRITQADAANWLSLGWQTLESLLPAPQAAMAFRTGGTAVRGGKRLTLGTGETSTVVLLVAVESETDERVSMRVQLRPEAAASLPDDLEISLLSPTGEAVQTVRRQPLDDYIQLKRFRLPPGYNFTIQVRSGSVTVQEPFMT
ncbi:MAG: DUF1822 family protein [Cyanobacteria bacterium J06635_1]